MFAGGGSEGVGDGELADFQPRQVEGRQFGDHPGLETRLDVDDDGPHRPPQLLQLPRQ